MLRCSGAAKSSFSRTKLKQVHMCAQQRQQQ
jgi:hypothetical protein